jgi:anhydro-N-acetylmuramic acid kinase
MKVIGLISGTSIDAIDAALVDIARDGDVLHISLLAFVMQPFDPAFRERVRSLMPPQTGSTVDVCEVNMLLGNAFAQAALRVADDAGVSIEQVDLIASHGQTVYHQIVPGSVRSTLQLGSAAVIAEQSGCTVVADFRPRDMAAGGEGAPLVPYLDVLLLRHPERHRAAQNIGGIGNVTYLPPSGNVLAFDTGPGNVLIDEAVRLLTNGAAMFDQDGQMSAAGTVNDALLAEWLSHPYFALQPPKSTGREQWGPGEAQQYVVQAQQHGLSPADTIATLTALTARSIANAYQQFLPQVDEVLVGGGGARNSTLLEMLQHSLPSTTVHSVDQLDLNADAKEAVAFALMGYATIHGWPSNVPAATGAARQVVLGNITPGNNYRALLQQVLLQPEGLPRLAQLVLAATS